jgi:hypothetical protein
MTMARRTTTTAEVDADHDRLIGEIRGRIPDAGHLEIYTAVSVAASTLTGEVVRWEWSVDVWLTPKAWPHDGHRYVFGGETPTLAEAVAATHRITSALAEDQAVQP